jgi:segregation and condensation protein B
MNHPRMMSIWRAVHPRAWRPRRTLQALGGNRLPLIYRLSHEAGRITATARGPLARDAQLALVEAVLFAAEEPLPARRIAALAGLKDSTEAKRLLRRLQSLYERDGTAFQVEEVAGGFQLLTRPEFHPWLARLRRSGHELRLSQPARETLAIVAYRQPIMRADIENIRGVQCGDVLRLLMEKGLIRIAGRHPSLGRPVLYGTTRKFLQLFGLKGLDELPLVEQLRMPAGGGESQA